MLSIRLNAAELTWILNHCEATVLIADPELLPILAPVLGELSRLKHAIDGYEALI